MVPAAGEPTAEGAQTIFVDSVTTEEEKKPRNQSTALSSRQRAISLPKTSSQTRSLSSGQSSKASERRPSKSVIQSRPTIKKTKNREPLSSPEGPKSKSSSRSAARRALQDRQSHLLLRFRDDLLNRRLRLRRRTKPSRTSSRATRQTLHWTGQYEVRKEDCQPISRC